LKKHTNLLIPNTFYHIYNRGINGEDIFKKEKNYAYFLSQYKLYLEPVADTYAYCLLKNHFHLLIKTKPENDIRSHYETKDNEFIINSIPHFISKQFSHLFNGYTQSINNAYDRTGGLFESPFRCIEVHSDTYFSQLIWYIHFNPQKHGFTDDFRTYPHSSYQSHLQLKATKLKREEVLSWFGDADTYIKYHTCQIDEKGFEKFIIEI